MSEFVAQIRAELDTSAAEQKLNNLTNGKHKIKVDTEIKTDEVDKQIKNLKNNQKIKLDADIDTRKAEQKLKSLKDNQKIKLDTDINIDSKSTKKGINQSIDQVEKQVKKKPIETELDYKVNKNSASQISRLKDSANSFFSLFTGNRNVVDFGTDKIRSAISDLKDLNTTLVEIDKSGNLTNKQLSDLGKNSYDAASKWGALVKDYLSSSDTFAQAGFSNLEEMSDLSTMAQMAGQMTADTSSKFIIASDAAWQMKGNVEKLTSVLDGCNMITNKNALNMSDLANGIRVAGSMMANSGLAEDQAAALIGTGVATTKDSGDTVARGLRTIIMNLRQIKGETEDGELIDQEQLKKVESTCNSVGVSLKTVKDGVVELRNPIDILRELSEVYNSLDVMDARRAQITDDIGGKHRSNILASILTNFNQYDKMLQDYSEGSGSAMREAMKTADSWEGRLNSLSNQWTEFVSGFVNTDLVKGGISGIEGMVSAFDKLNDAQLFIPTMISSIMGLQNLFTGKGLTDIGLDKDGKGSLGKLDIKGDLFGIDFTKMGNWKRHFSEAEVEIARWNKEVSSGNVSLKKFGGEFVKQNSNFRDYISGLDGASASLEGYKKHLSATGVEFEQFGNMKSIMTNALTGFLAGAGIELALAGITAFIDQVIYRQDRLSEKAEESKSAYSSTVSELQSINAELSTTQVRIDELRSKDKLFPDEQAELAQLERQNALLETQLNIKEKLADVQMGQSAKDAKESIDEASQKTIMRDADGEYMVTQDGMPMFTKINRKEYVRQQIEEMAKAQAKIDEAEKRLAEKDISDKDRKTYTRQFENATKNLEDFRKEASDVLSELNAESQGFYDEQTGKVVSGFEKDVQDIIDLNTEFNNFGLTNIEKQAAALNSFFDSSTKSNAIKDRLLEAAKSGEDVVDVLHEMGLTLGNLGLEGKGKGDALRNYFEGLAQSAAEAEKAIQSVDGTFKGVETAFESKNAGENWNKMTDYLEQAQELYKNGKIGTDDFQTATQWLMPDKVNEDAYKYDAEAYKAAWESTYNTVKRWFDKENPVQSMWNFADDLEAKEAEIGKNLIDINKESGEIVPHFESTAEAAKALGVNAQVVDTILQNLMDYGFEFDDVMFSGEAINEYKATLEGIRSIYESMESGSSKDKLGALLEGWDKEYAGFEQDLSTLTEDKIIKIQFEYDMAQLQSEIDELQRLAIEGDNTAKAALNMKKSSYRDKREENTGYDESSDEGYSNASQAVKDLQKQLSSVKGDDARAAIQDQISAIYDLQNAFQDFKASGGNLNWKKYLQSDQAEKVFDQITESTSLTKSEISELLGTETEPVKIKVQGEFDAADIAAKVKELETGGTISFTAKVNGIDSEVEGLKNEDGSITYTANIDGIETKLMPLLDKDGKLTFKADVDGIDKVVDSKTEKEGTVEYKPDTKAVDRYKAPQKPGIAYYTGNFSGIGNAPTIHGQVIYHTQKIEDPVNTSAGLTLKEIVSNVKKARVDGTAYNAPINYKSAYVNGKIALSQDEQALVNERGMESIVRNGKWMLLLGGMHIQALKKGDIVLNAEQTADLLKHGKTKGHARAYAEGTLMNAYDNGGFLPTASNNYQYTGVSSNSNNSTSSTAKDTKEAADASEDFKENLDAIEILISRIERDIKNIERVAGSAYNTFSKRNNALREQISSITEEISIQQQGYERYLQEAESVPLSEEYKNLVKNGAIDISTITDKDLSENINKFKEWYEKALDCRDAVEELTESVRDLYKQAFDNVVTLYDGMLSQIEHRHNMLEGYVEQTEAQGYIVSTKYYDAMISNEQNKLSKLNNERQELINALNDAIVNGDIEEGSESWYDMQKDINNVNEAIQEANTSIINFKNSIREIEWGIFDKIQDTISSITEEADFLTKIMSDEKMYDDKGNVTKHGAATYGLHGVNYNVYMAQADKYRKEMESIQKEISKDPYNQTLIERRKELLELQQESIIAAEDEKEAIVNLVKEGIEKQLESLDKLIDKYLDALDAQKDMYDYQKKTKKLQDEINSLEKQLSAYAGDDSEEGSVRRQQLQNDLKEARENMEENMYDKAISDQKKLLDELYNEYETMLNMRLDNIDVLISEVIANINSDASEIRDTIMSEADKVGYKLTDSMNTIWGSNGTIAGILTTYSSNFSSVMTSVQTAINNIHVAIQNAVNASNQKATANINSIDQQQRQQTTVTKPTTSNKPVYTPKPSTQNNGGDGVPRIGDKVTYVSGNYFYSSDGLNPSGNQMLGQEVYITNINNASWAQKPYHISRTSRLGERDLGWVNLDQLRGYRTGSNFIDRDKFAWTQEKGGELILGRYDGSMTMPDGKGMLTCLKRGDAVLNAKRTENLMSMSENPGGYIQRQIRKLKEESATERGESVGGQVMNEININVEVDAQNYNDFLTQMQHDPKFERMIHAMSIDRIGGKSGLGKYSVTFR